MARETREAQVAHDLKERAMATNDDTFMRVARFLSAVFFLVGEDTLSTKVRPSARRPGTTLEQEDGPGDTTGAAPAEGSAPTGDK